MSPSSLDRRAFVGGAMTGAAGLALGIRPARARRRYADPFTLGVASGDPLADGVVLWTRLAPEPTSGGGMPNRDVAVTWELATDERLRRVVRRGTEHALPQFAHSVHVDVRGLEPHREYFYRFRTKHHESPVGRTSTAPHPSSSPQRLRFAFASCQNWQSGFYPAYTDMAAQDLDLVVHLGDYIYESGPKPEAGPRVHEGPEVASLGSYRNRHALYKTDAALQAAHARYPWIVTPDDHDVENNYAGLLRDADAEANTITFSQRRANAYRAYWEHMPLRRRARPRHADVDLYRRFAWGDLALLQVLDTRQYRSDQPCEDDLTARCAAAVDPSQTMTGPAQERWLLDGLDKSRGTWNAIAQQMMFAQYDYDPHPASRLFNVDEWDGYLAARRRLLTFLAHRQPSNPVVITGDMHAFWVNDVKADFADPESRTLATELAGTSISSALPARVATAVGAARHANPHTRYFEASHRGYVRCEVTRGQWRADFRGVDSVATRSSPAATLASFVIQAGTQGATRL